MNNKIVILIVALILAPVVSLAGDPENPKIPTVKPDTGATVIKAEPPLALTTKVINIPVVTCSKVKSEKTTVRVEYMEYVEHSCLVALPNDATITSIEANRREDMIVNDSFHATIKLFEMTSTAREVGSFDLKSSTSSASSTSFNFNPVKSDTNSYYVMIEDFNDRSHSSQLDPYKDGISGVGVISVKYK